MRRTCIIIVALGVVSCARKATFDFGSDESSTSGRTSGDPSEPDLPEPDLPEPDLPEPVDCEDGADIPAECSSDRYSQSCGHPISPEHGVSMCEELVLGPAQFGLSQGLAACGCVIMEDEAQVRDLDGDGYDEIIAVCTIPDAVLVWRGRSDGALSCAEVYPTGKPGGGSWLIDLDEDGLDDLIAVHQTPPGMSLLRATAPGVFDEAQPLALDLDGSIVNLDVEFDVDGDGRNELLGRHLNADLNQLRVVLFRAVDGEVTTELGLYDTTGIQEVLRADLDGDGWPDLVVSDDQPTWMRGSPDGLGDPEPFNDGEWLGLGRFGLGDIDGDGLSDLVLGGDVPHYRLGNGDGTFGSEMVPDDPGEWDLFSAEPGLVEDLDGDGKAEIVLGFGPSWTLWRSSPLGPRFDMRVDLSHTIGWAAGDVDGDGRRDLVSVTLSPLLRSQITRWRAAP